MSCNKIQFHADAHKACYMHARLWPHTNSNNNCPLQNSNSTCRETQYSIAKTQYTPGPHNSHPPDPHTHCPPARLRQKLRKCEYSSLGRPKSCTAQSPLQPSYPCKFCPELVLPHTPNCIPHNCSISIARKNLEWHTRTAHCPAQALLKNLIVLELQNVAVLYGEESKLTDNPWASLMYCPGMACAVLQLPFLRLSMMAGG